MTCLQLYAEYILSEYKKINPRAEDSDIGCDLTTFIESGRIKGTRRSNSNDKLLAVLYMKSMIEGFAHSNNIEISILDYKTFSRKEKINNIIND